MKTKQTILCGFFAVILALTFIVCEQPTIDDDITYTAAADSTANTTAINFTFSGSVTGLTAEDITVTNGTGSATKGTLSGSGTSWSLAVTVGTAGNVSVSINKSGIEAAAKTVAVYKTGQTVITYTVTQSGGANNTANSTGIVFNFSASVDSLGLTAADITVSGAAAKDAEASLNGTGTTRTLPITVNAAGLATVSINKSGIEAATKTVTVHKLGQPTPEYWSVTWNLDGGEAGTGAYPTQIQKGTVLAKPSPNPTLDGFAFDDWYTDESLTTAYNFTGAVTADITLYAKWVEIGTGTAPTITTTSLPNGTVGTAYNQTLTATGTAPITWSLDSGALPTGLTLAATGAITGTPTAEGTSAFTVKAANAAGSATQELSITVLPGYVALYGTYVSTTGDYQPYTLTISADTIKFEDKDGYFVQYADVVWTAAENANAANKTNYPNGFTFTGTRTSSSVDDSINLGFVALSADGQSVYLGSSISTASNIEGAGAIYTKAATPPAITTTSLPGGTVGTAYSQTLTATGTAPITWSLDSGGALPAGLTLSGTGNISGTPTAAGSSTFTVKATNAVGEHTKQLTITIADPKAVLYGEWVSTTGSYQPYTLTITADTIRIEDKDGDFVQYANVVWTAAENANAAYKTNYPNGFTFTGTRTNRTYSSTFGFVALSADGQSVYVGQNASTASSISGSGSIYTKAATPDDITYAATANGNSTTTTTAITLTFSGTVTGLTANDITITNGTGSATKGGLIGSSGTTWTLTVTVVTAGNVTVSINKAGIESGNKTVAVYKAAVSTTREVTIAMWDYGSSGTGDGWDNSAALRINVNGTNLSTNARLASGSGPGYYRFNVNPGDVVQIYWVSGGQYDKEIAFAAYYTDDPPNPMFNPSSGTTGGKVLASKRYNSPSGAVGGGTSMGSFTVVGITLPIPVITTTSLTNGRVGQSYSQTLAATGDTPITWSLDSGSALPAGLALSTSGTISGTPTTDGTFTFTVKAANALGDDTKEFTLTIDPPIPPAITTTSLTNGRVGQSYSRTLAATGDTPITWSLDSGSALPAGLTLSTSGAISGTPTTSGTFTFTVKATNAGGDDTKEFTLTIDPPVTYTAAANNNTCTTAINFTFSSTVTGLSADDITITNGTGSATKGALSGSGTTRSLAVTVATAGDITVSINRADIESGTKTVTVSNTTITYTAASNSTTATTAINFTFSASIAGLDLTASDITITNGTGAATKEALSGSGASWSLAVTDVTAGNITVSINRAGIQSATKTVTVYKNWTAVAVEIWDRSVRFSGIAYGGNRFVAVARDSSSQIRYSNNGTSWTSVTIPRTSSPTSSPTYYYTYGIAYGGNRFVAVGDGGRMAYSEDNGVTWTTVNGIHEDYTMYGVAYGNNRFVAVGRVASGSGRGNTRMAYSSNGESWSLVSTFSFGAGNGGNGIAYGNGRFVAVGDSGTMAYSTDGATWTAVADSTFGTTQINGIAHNGATGTNSRWVAVGASGKMAYSTDNGVTWTAVANSTFGTTAINGIAHNGATGTNSRWVAVGASGKMAYSTDSGVTWTAESVSTFDTSDIYGIAYGANKFVAVGTDGKMAYSNF